ncbi:hypothetical protein AKO1_002624, partial [Acrasis kona]
MQKQFPVTASASNCFFTSLSVGTYKVQYVASVKYFCSYCFDGRYLVFTLTRGKGLFWVETVYIPKHDVKFL